MVQAIRVHQHGGPEQMRWESVTVPAPGPGEALVRHTVIGVNYIDVYFRTGLYQPAGLPFTPGMEAAGVVEAVGEGVTELAVGERVAYASPPPGSYAEQRVIAADRLVPLPDGIADEQAAGMMLKGMTAQYLLRRAYRVQPGDAVLIHAAAGGVGLIACQWARHLGAMVIGTVGSAEKAELARAHGCEHPIRYREEDFVERVRELTGGEGVAAVYDSVGRDTFERSLDCLRRRGTLVSFGQSSGPVPPLDVGLLAKKGSLFLTRPTLFHYTASREDLLATARELFEVVEQGAVRIEVNERFPLAEAAEAHRALEGRRTTGSTVLLP
ncbi:quinone oxidoreductase family protein [Spiribacter halobius]|uniref:NADPH:quinone reductase n=1 Tax=Sediminicurvatus halobius TaxID=2182432 RepID=A0A2U2MZN6_9GAMM|nr:quinone oxidoreductase [Spiribacter halobius]PWG62199.1 quinone oxidoreductase [Spiribacter halobius]UEX78105.1 quinone oxidoreductase [Spiribacter halobius]